MPRIIPVHTVASTPEDSRAELEALESKFGKVLNIHGEMAHAPVVIQAYVALQQVIANYGTFDGRVREAIALAVGNVDECGYCQAAHTAGGKAVGLSDDEMLQVRRDGVEFDAKLAALLTLAREMTARKGAIQDSSWQAALDAGWSDSESTELTTHVNLNLFNNYFSHSVETELDLPAAPSVCSATSPQWRPGTPTGTSWAQRTTAAEPSSRLPSELLATGGP